MKNNESLKTLLIFMIYFIMVLTACCDNRAEQIKYYEPEIYDDGDVKISEKDIFHNIYLNKQKQIVINKGNDTEYTYDIIGYSTDKRILNCLNLKGDLDFVFISTEPIYYYDDKDNEKIIDNFHPLYVCLDQDYGIYVKNIFAIEEKNCTILNINYPRTDGKIFVHYSDLISKGYLEKNSHYTLIE